MNIKKTLLERAAENAFQNEDPRLANALYNEADQGTRFATDAKELEGKLRAYPNLSKLLDRVAMDTWGSVNNLLKGIMKFSKVPDEKLWKKADTFARSLSKEEVIAASDGDDEFEDPTEYVRKKLKSKPGSKEWLVWSKAIDEAL